MIDFKKQNGLLSEDFYLDRADLINLNKLQLQLIVEENLYFDLIECMNIWQTYSSDLSASWLFFPDKIEDALKQIKRSDCFTTFEDYSK